ncbi:endonuclease/exonuclease/phosphatase family protein [Streptomyces sp. NPDC050264]|uniref:endonuclease/exonuclease/phosphatase family protein n=1 Tax=Streptomyces sp. NPDC050264 TaxID=3155038 RepID=UPI003429533B
MALGLSILPAAPAQAATVSADAANVAKSAGQRYALRSEANGLYVTADPNDGGKMTAKASKVGSWERFTLHTNHAGKNIALRSESTGFFASADLGGDGTVRAKAGAIASYEQFTVESRASDGPGQFALKSVSDGTYVTVEHTTEGGDVLHTRATSVGSWERFTLVPQGQAGTAGGTPSPAAAPSSKLNVMTWNICGNNNPGCWDKNLAGKDQVSTAIAERLPQPGGGAMPDVIFFQEFCEKHAKPVEEALEQRTGRGWDVRFAPTQYVIGELGDPVLGNVKAQKECAKADGLDRGSFGVAMALPDSNTSYEGYVLSSPVSYVASNGKVYKAEQRPALCADLPDRALHVCTSHFSAGAGYDDPDGKYRKIQAGELMDIVRRAPAGYRPVFGGDLNSAAPDSTGPDGGDQDRSVLTTMYASYRECAQRDDVTSPRTGTPTAVSSGPAGTGDPTMKIDYIFAPRNAPFTSCEVSSTHGSSDHWTLYGTIALPAA